MNPSVRHGIRYLRYDAEKTGLDNLYTWDIYPKAGFRESIHPRNDAVDNYIYTKCYAANQALKVESSRDCP